nr:hypothetical protein [Tanacetum cinerariifolium]
MEAGSKDRPPMLAPGNYVQWKSRIKRYIDTKLNHELIHHCLKHPPYKFTWADKEVLISEVQIILTGIYNDIYSTVDACPNACEMWKAIERLKKHQNEVNEIRAERIARTANPLALVAQQQPVYYPQNHPTQYNQNSSTRSQQAATRNRGKAIVNSSQPIYDQELSMVDEDDETSKDKEIDKLMALISLSFKKIYKSTNNNLRTSSNTSSTVMQKFRIQCYNCKEFGHVARECKKPIRVKDAAYHREKMLLCKQEDAGIQLNAEQAYWRDDTDDELEDQELEAHYMYIAQLQEVSSDAADSGPIFDTEPVQKVSTDDHYNVFAIESEHPKQSKSIHDTYLIEQNEHNVIIDSLDMSYDREQIDQNDDDNDLSNERELFASLIAKLKCEIDDNKNRNKSLETSNKVLIEKLKELARRNDVEYASKVEIDCAKARGDLISYKMESQKSFNKYTQTINDLNHSISKMKKKLCAHQETIFILSQQKEAQIKLYKTREDKEIDKVIALENKVKLVEIVLFIVDSGCSKHMTENLKLLINFVEKFLGTVKFRNDQIAPIFGYGDLVQGVVTIKRVYYVEGLNHNLFSVGQSCDADLEVAFRKSTCYIRDLKGNDLLTGKRSSNRFSWYGLVFDHTSRHKFSKSNLLRRHHLKHGYGDIISSMVMAKATSSQAWLWHRRLSHLNFDTINLLSKNDIVVGLPKLKFIKDHLCFSCELGKAKRKSFHTKFILSLKRRLHLPHGLMWSHAGSKYKWEKICVSNY